MVDSAKVLIAMTVIGGVTLSIKFIASAVVRMVELRTGQGNNASNRISEARLERIEQAVDSIAVEVERISENQRFTTRLLSDRSSVGNP